MQKPPLKYWHPNFKFKVCNRLILKMGFSVLVFFMGAWGIFAGIDKWFPPDLHKLSDQSIVILDRHEELLAVHLSKDQRYRLPVTFSEVDPLFIRLLVHFEDKRFFQHCGVDLLALARAIFQCAYYGRRISGGSTLTMQVARLLEKRPRSFPTKCIEIFRALQLEKRYSKGALLEMYLCLAPYGGNLEGVRAASWSLFSKEPRKLKPSEAALLAVLPQSPTRLRPHLFPEKAKKFRDKLIDRMLVMKVFNALEASEAKEDVLPTLANPFPRVALHLFSEFSRHEEKTQPESKLKNREQVQVDFEIKTTIDKTLQQLVEKRIQAELPFLEPNQTIAVLIVENDAREIRSYVGSADFFSERRHGQVNMVRAIRSPGSTLKPFIYGFGFDQGVIHPDTLIQDAPTTFSDYAPSNFKDVFHGEVTVRQALQQSLNIPAVAVLDKIGPGRWVDWLDQVGVKLKFKDARVKPALPIALGGVGIRMWDLTTLYVALANQGEYLPLTLRPSASPLLTRSKKELNHAPVRLGTHLLSKEAAWQLTHILQDSHAPDGFLDNQFSQAPAFAYKTGTSYGYRDAWAIGYTSQYTIAVWVGKPDGTPSINHTGRKTAAPVLFKLLSLLPPSKSKNQNINTATKSKEEPLFTSKMVLSKSLLSKNIHDLPKHLLKFSKEKNRGILNENELSIQFPKEGAQLFLEKIQENSFRPIPVFLSGGKPPYYGFVNGEPLDQSSHQPRFTWTPKAPGFVEFSVVDSEGNCAAVAIELKN